MSPVGKASRLQTLIWALIVLILYLVEFLHSEISLLLLFTLTKSFLLSKLRFPLLNIVFSRLHLIDILNESIHAVLFLREALACIVAFVLRCQSLALS